MLMMQALRNREVVCGICSEEEDDFIPVNPNASYVVLMDPLDGKWLWHFADLTFVP